MNLKVTGILCLIILGVFLAGCTGTGEVTGAASEILENGSANVVEPDTSADVTNETFIQEETVEATGEMEITDIWRPLSFKVGETDEIKVEMTKTNDVPNYEFTVSLAVKENENWREIDSKKSKYTNASEETFEWTPTEAGDFELRVAVDGDEKVIPIKVVGDGRRKIGKATFISNIPGGTISNLEDFNEVFGIEGEKFKNIFGEYTYIITHFKESIDNFIISIKGPGINEEQEVNYESVVIKWSNGRVDLIDGGYTYIDNNKLNLYLMLSRVEGTIKVNEYVRSTGIKWGVSDIITNGEQQRAEVTAIEGETTKVFTMTEGEATHTFGWDLRLYLKSITTN